MKNNNWSSLNKTNITTTGKSILLEPWFESNSGRLCIWSNHKLILDSNFNSVDDAKTAITSIIDTINSSKTTLGTYLKLTNQHLTELEITTLEYILGEGSFYEEAASYNKETEEYYVEDSCFIGWEIEESEVPGCRGALASLVKKGILTIEYDESTTYQFGHAMACYYINKTPIFKKDGHYHQLDLEA